MEVTMRYARRGGEIIGVIVLVIGALTACHQRDDSRCGTGVTLLIESGGVLGDDAHRYYDDVTAQLKKDPLHVQNIKSSWETQRSIDNKAAFVEVDLAGQQQESAEVVHNIVDHTPAPTYEKTWVIGPCHSLEGEAAWERHLAGRAPGQ
jgi:uncharacterized membrane protein YdfJ with MMPL/SSD domain